MRDYGRVATVFWQKGSGKRLRGDVEAQVVALYLLSCASANSSGLYYLPLPTIAHETGIPIEGASKALQRVCEAGFADYDEANELVWVPNLALIEVGAELRGNDKRKPHLEESIARHGNHPFVKEFYSKYGGIYGLAEPKPLRSPFEGPYKPLRSHSHSHSQCISNSNATADLPATPKKRTPKPKASSGASPPEGKTIPFRVAWLRAYLDKYGQEYPWGSRENGQVASLLGSYSVEQLIALIPYWFAWQRPEVIRGGHSLGKGAACFLLKIDELRADIADSDRRRTAAQVVERERLTDAQAADEDGANRINAILAKEREDARRLAEYENRSLEQAAPNQAGALGRGGALVVQNTQQGQASGRGGDAVLPFPRTVRERQSDLASVGSVLRGRAPTEHPRAQVEARTEAGAVQGPTGIDPEGAEAQ